jgi:undecaprenyl-diphosphatase
MFPRILIADDNSKMINFMREYFSGEGYEVLTAADSSEAAAKAEENPDVILLNIMLPGMDLQSLYRYIRKKACCPVLFFVPAKIIPEKNPVFKDLNVSREDLINIPFSISDLNRRVKTLLKINQKRGAKLIYRVFEVLSLPFIYFSKTDKKIFYFFTQKIRNPLTEKIMIFCTRLGNGGFIWFMLSLLCCAFSPYRKIGLISAFSAASCAAANFILKVLFKRPRPFLDYWPQIPLKINHPADMSFPSGHTSVSFAAAGILSAINIPAAFFVMLMAASISFSRLYLMVHYPSDILGGMVLGWAFSYGFSFIL